MSGWDRIRCVVFDFDGTLVESNAIKRDTFFEIFDAFAGSRRVVERILNASPGADRYAIVPAVRDALIDEEARSLPEPTSLVAAYTERCEQRVVACPALPGAQEALDSLSGRYPLYLDSSSPQDTLIRIVERRGWSHYFRAVLGRPADKVANLRVLADRERLAAQQILLVGDGPPDLAAAQEFQCAFLGFRHDAETLLAHPDLAALAPLVSELHSRSV
jgi:phosphoglycolate phosphatase-like HAD superfamily hydrolase